MCAFSLEGKKFFTASVKKKWLGNNIIWETIIIIPYFIKGLSTDGGVKFYFSLDDENISVFTTSLVTTLNTHNRFTQKSMPW